MQKVQTLQEQESFTITGPELEVLGRAETKLPAPLKKRSNAALIAVALALVAVLGIGGAKLRGQYNGVLAAYRATSSHGYGIQSDLSLSADYAANLIRMGETLLGKSNEEVAAAQAALDTWNATDSGSPAAQSAANGALTAAADALYQAAAPQAGDKATLLESNYQQMTSQQDIIRRETNQYNTVAESYNQKTQQFPAAILSALWGAGKAELFA